MGMGGKDRGGALGAFKLGGGNGKGAGALMPTPGSTEHAVFVLVAIELAALVFLRRYMKSAHGG